MSARLWNIFLYYCFCILKCFVTANDFKNILLIFWKVWIISAAPRNIFFFDISRWKLFSILLFFLKCLKLSVRPQNNFFQHKYFYIIIKIHSRSKGLLMRSANPRPGGCDAGYRLVYILRALCLYELRGGHYGVFFRGWKVSSDSRYSIVFVISKPPDFVCSFLIFVRGFATRERILYFFRDGRRLKLRNMSPDSAEYVARSKFLF